MDCKNKKEETKLEILITLLIPVKQLLKEQNRFNNFLKKVRMFKLKKKDFFILIWKKKHVNLLIRE